MSSLPNLNVSLAELRAFNREQWLGLITKRLQPVILLLAVIVIAWQLAQLTWMIFKPSNNATPVPVMVQPVTSPNRQSINTQAIADAHLFGIETAAPEADPGNLPQTSISLVLAGTIAFSDPQAGYAIVGENASNAKFYKVGGMINGGIRLHSVYADRVIIDRAGTLETLSLPHGPSTGMPSVNRPAVNPGAQLSENIRRMATNNPSALSQILRVQPVFSNGAQKGFRVYPGRDRAQFARLGLQPGDLITAVNGMALNDAGAANDILGLLSSSTSVVVGVERNGAPMQLNLDVTQISLPDDNANAEPPGEPGMSRDRMRRTPPMPGPSTE
ncbi:MAG TPA: type II secretion system protein GspC [Steroidobacteraceae bacterium]|jgi:general secretion pathway protein C|nr:type II secretion system protein GspC [Steroidobacteraceae bacterium]